MGYPNMSELHYPSQTLGSPYIAIEDIISSQNIISRVMHSYLGILVPLGLLAGIFSLVVLIKNKIKYQIMENLDFYLLCLAITDITIIMYSFTSSTRPDYLEISNISCGVLCLFFNISYFFSQYLLLVMLLMLVVDMSASESRMIKFITNWLGCLSLTMLFSVTMSLVTVSLLGTYSSLQNITHCQLDPLNASPNYDLVKFSIGFCVPSIFILLLSVLLIVQVQRTDEVTRKEKLHGPKVILLDICIMFVCRLFYNIMLLRRMRLKIVGSFLTPREEMVMNIAELVVFSGSCIRLICTMTLHKPCWDGVKKSLQFFRKLCKTETSNSVI
ncbi:uncharacterized protein ACMZJ9_010504 [Mantella aurantiaca]